MATLLTQPGVYHCPECLRPILFEAAERAEYIGDQLDKRGFAIGKCTTSSCDRRGIRVKVRLQTIEVEELPSQAAQPTTEENPHGAQETTRVAGSSER